MSYQRNVTNDKITDESIFEELEGQELASKWTRFGNLIIDSIIIQIFIYSLTFISIYLEINYIFNIHWILDIMVSYFLHFIYYSVMENATKGKTIGKYITGTRVVTTDDTTPDFDTIIRRSLCRIIPFNEISFLGEHSTGWHDSMSKTKVIKES